MTRVYRGLLNGVRISRFSGHRAESSHLLCCRCFHSFSGWNNPGGSGPRIHSSPRLSPVRTRRSVSSATCRLFLPLALPPSDADRNTHTCWRPGTWYGSTCSVWHASNRNSASAAVWGACCGRAGMSFQPESSTIVSYRSLLCAASAARTARRGPSSGVARRSECRRGGILASYDEAGVRDGSSADGRPAAPADLASGGGG